MTIEFTDRYYPQAAARFAGDAADHQMTVLHDDGVYRHLRFADPDHGAYAFELVTWPGHLAITGDVAAFTFCQAPDMFEFFGSSGYINPGNWSEKIVSTDARNGHHREWDLTDWTWGFLWSCCAIRWGISQYRALTPASAPPAAAA